jgi:hypothetical protein
VLSQQINKIHRIDFFFFFSLAHPTMNTNDVDTKQREPKAWVRPPFWVVVLATIGIVAFIALGRRVGIEVGQRVAFHFQMRDFLAQMEQLEPAALKAIDELQVELDKVVEKIEAIKKRSADRLAARKLAFHPTKIETDLLKIMESMHEELVIAADSSSPRFQQAELTDTRNCFVDFFRPMYKQYFLSYIYIDPDVRVRFLLCARMVFDLTTGMKSSVKK